MSKMDDKKLELIERLRQIRAEIRLITVDLETLGAHFYGVGNFHVWDMLRSRSERLHIAVDAIDNVGHQIREDFDE